MPLCSVIDVRDVTDTQVIMIQGADIGRDQRQSSIVEAFTAAYKVGRDKNALVDAPKSKKGKSDPQVQRLFEKAIDEVFLEREPLKMFRSRLRHRGPRATAPQLRRSTSI